MIRPTILASVASFALATPAMAQQPSSAAKPNPAKEQKLCRIESSTGSMMTTKTCHTAKEWTAIDDGNSRRAADFLRQSQGHARAGGGGE